MRASLAGDKKIVKLLIQKGATINHKNQFSESAIFHTAQANCEECFKIILKNNLKIKEVDFLDIKKNILSAIEVAKKRDNQEIISSGSLWLNIVSKKIKNKAKNNNLIQKVKYLQRAKRFNIKNEENIPKFNLISKDRGRNLSYIPSLNSAFKTKEVVKNFLIKKGVDKKYQLKATLDNQENILKIAKFAGQEMDISSDIYHDAEIKRHLLKVMVKRALLDLLGKASNGTI
jgi:ankyrin repeat protein